MGSLTTKGGTERAGDVKWCAANSVPPGWIKANGAALNRTTYATLFSVIGTTYGAGDGASTFNAPDLRGEFVRGFDDARGVDASRVFGSAQADDLKSHTHTVPLAMATYYYGGTSTPVAQTGTSTSSATGGTETRPRNVAMLAVIKF